MSFDLVFRAMQLTLEPVLTATVLSGFWSEDFWDGGHIAVKCMHISFCYMLSSEVCVLWGKILLLTLESQRSWTWSLLTLPWSKRQTSDVDQSQEPWKTEHCAAVVTMTVAAPVVSAECHEQQGCFVLSVQVLCFTLLGHTEHTEDM